MIRDQVPTSVVAAKGLGVFRFYSRILRHSVDLAQTFCERCVINVAIGGARAGVYYVNRARQVRNPTSKGNDDGHVKGASDGVMHHRTSREGASRVSAIAVRLERVGVNVRRLFCYARCEDSLLSCQRLQEGGKEKAKNVHPVIFFKALECGSGYQVLLPIRQVRGRLAAVYRLLLIVAPPLANAIRGRCREVLRSHLFRLKAG